jgi:hypothetical protein
MEMTMPTENTPLAKLTTVASFPKNFFVENLAMRSDDSVLVSVMNRNELWYVPPVNGKLPVEPLCIHTFGQPTMNIVEIEPDIFYLSTCHLYTTHDAYLHRLDMRGWIPGQPVKTEVVLRFPDTARGLNGGCLIAPKVMLVADCFAGLIWRVDLPSDGGKPAARIWLKHASMDYDPNGPMPDQPGINGVQYASKTHYVYYTSTAKQLFMRVRVNPSTHDPVGQPEFVAGGRMADDFRIDENVGVAYLTTHRQNTIDRVPLEPSENTDFVRHTVAGVPFTNDLIGPTSGAWGRGPGEDGRVAYFLSDGGTKSPPKEGPQPAKLTRVEF